MACDEFVKRMDGHDFHGGDMPDSVDFRLFSVVDRCRHTSVIINLVKEREEEEMFNTWFRRMT
jgi:hypothetical protein